MNTLMGKVKIRCALLFFFVGLSGSETLLAASDYALDSENSSLYFVTTRQTHDIENHFFRDLSGSISSNGQATLNINLGSVETGVATRNQRVRDLLFEVGTFSQATVTLPVDLARLSSQASGSAETQAVSATLDLHGVFSNIDTELVITRLSDTTIMVQNASPILIRAGDFNLTSGIDTLRNLANLDVISYTVPVNFTLLFSTQ